MKKRTPPPIGVLIEELATDPERGLTVDEVHRRRERHGLNRIEEVPPLPVWRRFSQQFRELVVWILIVAAVVSGLLGDWPDTFAILAIVLLNALLGFFQEERAQRSLNALRSLAAPHARVIRGGETVDVSASHLVPGDLVALEAGDQVPADGRLVESFGLGVEEASLTGESAPASKDARAAISPNTALADRSNMVWSGTVVVAGKARAVVTRTGMRTEIGRIARLLRREPTEKTPLQERLQRLGKVLIFVCLISVVVLFALQMLRGGEFREVFLLSVSLAVAAVPEGLPAVVTITLALGLQRMVRKNALIRRLPSVETLGSVSVICSDKTGTLTRNEMTVREVVAGDVTREVSGSGYALVGDFRVVASSLNEPGGEEPAAIDEDLLELLRIGAFCNDAKLTGPVDGEVGPGLVGDPTEGALLVVARKAGIQGDRSSLRVIGELPFDSDRKLMSVLVKESSGRARLLTKGAAEAVLCRCASERVNGDVVPLTDERRARRLQQMESMASRALRVLGIASRDVERERTAEIEESDLVFAGLVGMIDPPARRGEGGRSSMSKRGDTPRAHHWGPSGDGGSRGAGARDSPS